MVRRVKSRFLTGLPPTAGFIGKLYLFSAVLNAGWYVLAVVAAINSVVSLYYYMRLVKTLWLDEPEGPEPPPPVDAVLPWPVLRFTGPLAGQPWKWLGPGVHGVDLPQPTDGLPLRLIRMRAGARMPHRHEGFESGVVLAGGWDDEYGTYRRGDATVYAPDTHPTHDQRIHDDEDCIAIVLNESRAVVEGRLFGPLARLLFRI